MPSGTGVVDAFKNLIRHGKNHHAARQQDDSSHAQYQPQQQAAQPQLQPTAQQRQREAKSQQQPQPAQPQEPAQKNSSKFKEHVESIVQEEREAKGKMPIYKGLENYKLLDKMGDGAFSNVYKAIDIRTGQKVAVKVVRKYELSASQAGDKHLNREFKKKPRVTERANILKEVQIMRGTSHPSIVKLYAFFESPEHYFLVLELLEGGELFHQIVKLTYFSENLARHVILQVAQGIRYLHEERGVVHRDIKPENLLFEPISIVPSANLPPKHFEEDKEDEGEFIPGVGGGGIGRVKIADFGLSKVVWDEQTMTPCGTVGYTAPEIVKDERYSKSVDMWALGCVLYTLLCGFPPFYDESINVLTEKVARGYYTFLSPWWDAISDSAKDLITHLLCVDPAQRYTIDEFLAHPWCNAAPAPPPPPTPLAVPLDSPLLASVRGGVPATARSPGLASLKEAFDITYAVHRMEEEGARRRAAKGGANRGFLGHLNESDEEEDDEPPTVMARGRQLYPGNAPQAATAASGAGAKAAARRAIQDNYDGRAGQRDRGKRGHHAFELDLENATLLGRRHRRGVNAGADVSSPLSRVVQQPKEIVDVPGSPMRLD
ncbi:Pkinase-domain-containing protein [Laetiporus sulphureus 93-53]|uniref:Pkinase-domain-containing protein n=1 Tax=Laetiporus sulphureus 93-53 TaxID=1314785 RepID=A0A165I7F3_9APHY|nr:Pkinase-domain-containing protein [Laetiporus sulphureus 93-53]KZT12688.1 Pkinase-domain-containing protein [Laetiporus sulphureus 93-53]